MVIRKPYAFLIKNFKKIHLFLSFLLIFIEYRTYNLLSYFEKLIRGTESKNLASNYISNFNIFLIVISIIIFAVIYILMRYKKKPKFIYLVSILGYITLIVFLVLSYSYLNYIKAEYIVQKSIRLYRDLMQIGVYFQTVIVIVMLIRGLGFDIKRFDFAKDLQEFQLEEKDSEEIEVNVNVDYNRIDRGFNRTRRELKYYFFENKLIILFILVPIIAIFALTNITKINNGDNKYSQNKLLKFGYYEMQVEETYITNVNYKNEKIKDEKFAVVKFKIKSNDVKKASRYSSTKFSINYKDKFYVNESKYCGYFSDIGTCYKNPKITDEFKSYILVFDLKNKKVGNSLELHNIFGSNSYIIKLDEKKTINLEYKLNDNIDLKNTNLNGNSYKITSYNISNKFDYTYSNCLSNGQCNTFNSSVSSVIGTILELNVEYSINSNSFNLNNSTFIEYYSTLKYKKDSKEYTSILNNKTSNKVNDKVYLEVDKAVADADSIWLEFDFRGNKVKYILK